MSSLNLGIVMTLQHPHLLEISAWPWLERLGSDRGQTRVRPVSDQGQTGVRPGSDPPRRRPRVGDGGLGDVPSAEWDRIAAAGFDYVFLMGVWRRSPLGREIARTHPGLRTEYDRVLPGWTSGDVPGSPYCIAAYEPDDRMGGWDGLDAARRALADRGIRLMLDFVPNHTAFDHSWIRHHPERYVTATEDDFHRSPSDFRKVDTIHGTTIIACARDPYFPPWTDVAQLNYFNPDTRAAMRATLRTIAEHCDAVRCDMAMLVLNDVFDSTWRRLLRDSWPPLARDFWVEATRDLPNLEYVAEVYWNLEARLLDEGFTFAYDKRLLDGLHARDAASIVRDVLAAPAPPPQRLARFIENHDEPRSAAHLSRCVPAAAALVATAPGLRFFFDGQLEGRRIRAPVQLGRWPDEPVDDAIRQMYTRTLQFARAPLLHDGEWRLLHLTGAGDHSFNDIVAYRWRLGEALAVVALNFGGSASQAHVWISDDLPRGREFDFVDARDGARYRWSRESLLTTGLYVRLEAGAAHLFNVDTVDPSV
jgi:alpha amylase-like protein